MPTETPVRYDRMAPRAPEGPIDLREVVPGEGPLEIDIGFGRGQSLFERAAAAPEARLLGIEVKSKLAYQVDERRKKRGLERMRVFAGDAKEILGRAGPEGSVARVFLYFPDPWWKKRHAKRRVIGDELLDTLARLLAPGGELFIQTDVDDRAEAYLALVRAHEAFEIAGGGYLDHNPFGARSNRERRADEDGLPVYRILARRR